MGFYLRKSFRAGPLRLNLSKRGLGASVGVPGLRLGLSSSGGTYVSGGAGGAYFRKNLGGRRGRQAPADSGVAGEPVTIRQDTDVTYASETRAVPSHLPLEEELVRETLSVTRYLLIPLIGLCIAGVLQSVGQGALSAVVALGSILSFPYPMSRAATRNRRGSELGELLRGNLLKRVPLSATQLVLLKRAIQDPLVTPADGAFQRGSVYLSLIKAITADRGITDAEMTLMSQAESLLDLGAGFVRQARLQILQKAALEMIADHELTPVEEAEFNHLRERLGIPEQDIAPERDMIDRLREIREIRQGNLSEIRSSMPLAASEPCYYEGPVRVLKEKVLKSFRREGIKHTIRGLVVDKEGRLLITARRLLVVHEGTTSIPLTKILDVELDYDEKLITLVKDGSKTPVRLTTIDAPRAAAIISSLAAL